MLSDADPFPRYYFKLLTAKITVASFQIYKAFIRYFYLPLGSTQLYVYSKIFKLVDKSNFRFMC